MNYKFTDLDYFVSKDKIVYLVKGYYHTKDRVFAYPVFWPDINGDRVHSKWGRYRKNVSDFGKEIFKIHPEYSHNFVPRNTPLVFQSDIAEVFHPQDRIKQFKQEWRGFVWYDIFDYLTGKLKIPEKDMGIFGSYLVGLNKNMGGSHIKDVDFAVYGLENFYKVRNGMEVLLKHFGFSHIGEDHIVYHQEKFGSLFNPEINSFNKTLANKWPSIQIKTGLLNTLRFVYKKNEIPKNPILGVKIKRVQIEGIVVDDTGVNFMPRTFKIETNGNVYTIITYFWAFQSCVKNGDRVFITGDLYQGRVVAVDDANHGIKISG